MVALWNDLERISLFSIDQIALLLYQSFFFLPPIEILRPNFLPREATLLAAEIFWPLPPDAAPPSLPADSCGWSGIGEGAAAPPAGGSAAKTLLPHPWQN